MYITRQSTSRKMRWGIIVSSSVNGAAEQQVADATRMARRGADGKNENTTSNPPGHATIYASGRRSGGSSRDEGDTEERNAARSFVSFSSGKKVDQP